MTVCTDAFRRILLRSLKRGELRGSNGNRMYLRSCSQRARSSLSPGQYLLSPKSDLSKLATSFEPDLLPEALRWCLPWKQSTLSNGLQVITEPSAGPLACLTLTVEAGSRHDGLKNSGLSAAVVRLKKAMNSSAIAQLEDLGASIDFQTQREVTQFHVRVDGRKLQDAFLLLGEILTPRKIPQSAMEAVSKAMVAEVEKQSSPEETIIETVHASAFRGSPLGMPLSGTKKSLQALLPQDVNTFQDTFYLGNRMSLAATGAVTHDQVHALASQCFGKLRYSGSSSLLAEPPAFSGSQVQIKASGADQVHVGVFFKSPARSHNDYYAFQVLKHLMSAYRPDRDDVHNVVGVQTCNLQKWLGDLEDVTSHKTELLSYRDCGLLGHVIGCWELGAHLAPIAAAKAYVQTGGYITETELSRAKNCLYRELLTRSAVAHCGELSLDALYLQRRVPGSEIAARVALMDAKSLQKVARKWFWNNELVVVFYGAKVPERDYGVYRSVTTSRQ